MLFVTPACSQIANEKIPMKLIPDNAQCILRQDVTEKRNYFPKVHEILSMGQNFKSTPRNISGISVNYCVRYDRFMTETKSLSKHKYCIRSHEWSMLQKNQTGFLVAYILYMQYVKAQFNAIFERFTSFLCKSILRNEVVIGGAFYI